ncbi:MAG: ABC transporter [Desulfocapsa sp.]|nr:MAG: ABC transporter [Desulfocapsa sp.]
MHNDDPAVPVIQIEDLSFSYDQSSILSDVNLIIHELDSICVVGPNGGGKTTLIKCILGLLVPDKGTVRVFGLTPEQARLRMGYVPQYASFDPFFPISVMEVVCMGRLGGSFTGKYSTHDKEQALAALEKVDLAKYATRSFTALSGGQRQRVLIARALATGCDLLILDEPTANIDHTAETRFFDLLSDLNEKMTILMVTHEVGFASTFFKRVACVNNKVVIHPTSELTGELIQNMYGGDLQMIRHDHRCCEGGHSHD